LDREIYNTLKTTCCIVTFSPFQHMSSRIQEDREEGCTFHGRDSETLLGTRSDWCCPPLGKKMEVHTLTQQKTQKDTCVHKDIALECKSLQGRSIRSCIQQQLTNRWDNTHHRDSEWDWRTLLGNNGHNDTKQVGSQPPMGRNILRGSSYKLLLMFQNNSKSETFQRCSAGKQYTYQLTILCIH
jgi:hypothetical protein